MEPQERPQVGLNTDNEEAARLGWLDGLDESLRPFQRSAEQYFGASLGSRRGADGLRWLAQRIDEAARAEQLDERAFVEAAGALLALILVDHVGDGALVRSGERLRVCLGVRGWLDPFAAVEGSLEAERPARELQRRVAQAEAEAADLGVMSRVLKGVEQGLRDRGLVVTERFETQYRLDDGTELDLKEVVAGTREGSAADARLAVTRFLSLMDGYRTDGRSSADWAQMVDRIVPRLVGDVFVRELEETGKGAVLAVPWMQDLWVAWVERRGNRSRFVTQFDLETLGVSRRALHEAAITNLAKASAVSRYTVETTKSGPVLTFQTRDGADAARLLLPALASVLGPELGEDIRVAVPHRDTLLAAAPAALEELRARCQEAYAAAPHRISRELFALPLPTVQT